MLIEVETVRSDLADYAKSFIEATLARTTASEKPTLIHMCGIPGAGKTTYTNFYLKRNPHFALVQFDSVMENLPGYAESRASSGPAQAFAQFEIPARTIGYHLLEALLDNGRDVFFDHGGLNRNHVKLLKAVQEKGFVVEMHYIECNLETALNRVFKREQSEGRHTPRAIVDERYVLLQELLPVYQELTDKFVIVEPSEYMAESSNICLAGANEQECVE